MVRGRTAAARGRLGRTAQLEQRPSPWTSVQGQGRRLRQTCLLPGPANHGPMWDLAEGQGTPSSDRVFSLPPARQSLFVCHSQRWRLRFTYKTPDGTPLGGRARGKSGKVTGFIQTGEEGRWVSLTTSGGPPFLARRARRWVEAGSATFSKKGPKNWERPIVGQATAWLIPRENQNPHPQGPAAKDPLMAAACCVD